MEKASWKVFRSILAEFQPVATHFRHFAIYFCDLLMKCARTKFRSRDYVGLGGGNSESQNSGSFYCDFVVFQTNLKTNLA